MLWLARRLPAVDLGPGRSAVSVATGKANTCVLLDNRQVRTAKDCEPISNTTLIGRLRAQSVVPLRHSTTMLPWMVTVQSRVTVSCLRLIWQGDLAG